MHILLGFPYVLVLHHDRLLEAAVLYTGLQVRQHALPSRDVIIACELKHVMSLNPTCHVLSSQVDETYS